MIVSINRKSLTNKLPNSNYNIKAELLKKNKGGRPHLHRYKL